MALSKPTGNLHKCVDDGCSHLFHCEGAYLLCLQSSYTRFLLIGLLTCKSDSLSKRAKKEGKDRHVSLSACLAYDGFNELSATQGSKHFETSGLGMAPTLTCATMLVPQMLPVHLFLLHCATIQGPVGSHISFILTISLALSFLEGGKEYSCSFVNGGVLSGFRTHP